MKRIVQCPKCAAKLAVFDLGKPINQKCPKCGNVFVVDSDTKKPDTNPAEKADEPVKAPADEPKKDGPAAAEKPAAAVHAETKPAEEKAEQGEEKPAEEKKPVEDKKPAEAKKPAEEKKEEPARKPEPKSPVTAPKSKPALKPQTAPSASITPSDQTAQPAGPSPLFNAIILGGLVLIIIMQLITKVQANKQYGKLIEHLQYIEKNLSK